MSDSLTLRVTGMTCAACTSRVERVVSKVDGVQNPRANLITGSVTVDGVPDPAEMATRIQKAGFGVETVSTQLALQGMSCASCVARVERILSKLPGVRGVQVNLTDESARIEHLEISGIEARLAQAATKGGFPARALRDSDRSERQAQKVADQVGLLRAFFVALLLTLPVFVSEMGGHVFPSFHHWLHGFFGLRILWIGQFVLTTAVLFGPGWRFFRAGVPALLHRAPDMNSLVVLGAGAAWAYSTVATFAPGLLPAATRAVYFEAAAVIVTLILLGRWLEARAKGQTGAAIARLAGLQTRVARVQRGDAFVELPVEEIAVGDLIDLRAGERVAVDGEVTQGQSWLDESMISGEPVPVDKTLGDVLIAGSVNGAGLIQYRATHVGADTVLARIIRMVEDAQGAKLPIQAVVDRITRVFVPVVLGLALVTALVWALVGPEPRLTHALIAAVSVLIIACPCAMGLATPVSIMVGTGRGADHGILFRRGDALQALEGVTLVAFDKTGTLTQGRPELVQVQCAPEWTGENALTLAAALESSSEHPLARAILGVAQLQGVTLPIAEAVEVLPGFGIAGTVAGQSILLGSGRLMQERAIGLGGLADRAESAARRGETPMFLAVDGQIAAVLCVADPIKPGAPEAVSALQARGLQVAMVSGDTQLTAQAVADKLGITDVHAEALPQDKLAAIQTFQAAGHKVAFVGDGINDAPVLAAADVGIAMGTGTDVAMDAAEVVLMQGDPRLVAGAVDLSTHVLRNIRQNLFWAFAYNSVLIPVAAGALYPAFGLLLSPMLGAAAMALSSVFVVTNALRLRNAQIAGETARG